MYGKLYFNEQEKKTNLFFLAVCSITCLTIAIAFRSIQPPTNGVIGYGEALTPISIIDSFHINGYIILLVLSLLFALILGVLLIKAKQKK